MSIKLLTKISLPYLLRLQFPESIETELPVDDNFSFFKIVFLPNIDELENKNFSPNYNENFCNTIEVEAVLNKYHHINYSIEKSSIYDTYNVTTKDRTEIFKEVRVKLNHFLLYISKSTKMFWVEDLAINPLSGVIGTHTDFIFLNPEHKVNMNSRIWNSIADNFMVDLYRNKFQPISEKLLDDYKGNYVVNFTWVTYINKATKALYKSEFEEFIIYCAIAAESFIKMFVSTGTLYPSKFEDDIVLDKLISIGKNNMVDTYYKVILKYLYGVNLLELNQALFNNLKDIFNLRNDIMHKGIMDENSFKKVGINDLNFEQASLYLNRLNQAIETCLKLPLTKVQQEGVSSSGRS
ncbi:hypothetical protein [Fictibacillus sp. 26RED30]|uniref:hypothetical protein n=1 Tax=Fictibacillus sp. 26RED30 TaxID=2745877 RepID=UPI0018CD3694|nr:hypothetical protein [Fictibacillus sp. 26RED30]MBH0159641.1 hypothetical protein [Fictibacillus sp. 26RED30]